MKGLCGVNRLSGQVKFNRKRFTSFETLPIGFLKTS
ncbi:MAG: hypothetical protein ACI9LS_002131, partial [Flavobacteriales bacterium]